jgi:small GTP-binding protein
MNIALVGLPSCGKSSIINSLIGKRVAQSGVSRTTTDVKLYEELTSDDNCMFNIYDLPGIADIEDKDNKFDDLIFETIKKCNMVIWVSDIIKAFITNHEMQEFDKIRNYINGLAFNDNLAIQFVVMLSKVDINMDNIQINKNIGVTTNTNEILDEEDTTIIDIYNGVKSKLPDIDVVCFNAFGRSYYNKHSSPVLRSFVQSYRPVDVNTGFLINKYKNNIPFIKDVTQLVYCFKNKFRQFLRNNHIKKCIDTKDYSEIAKIIQNVFDNLCSNISKRKIIKFLLYIDNSTENDYMFGMESLYDKKIWNLLCMYIKIDIKPCFKYDIYNKKLCQTYETTPDQIYRFIQIGKDLTLSDKLLLYTLDNCKTIYLAPSISFVRDHIYNLEYYTSGKVFELTNSNYISKNNEHNYKYTTEIYSTKLLTEIKHIREETYGELENDININMIPIAYEKYGLFW